MEISKRLNTIISLVEPGKRAADIGTDHGYVPVELVRRGICERALAMDVRRGPLAAAEKNIRAYGLEGQVETRLSEGLERLSPGEADRIVIAGMGGALMQRILTAGEEAARAAGQLVLSPQSDLSGFRRFLCSRHYRIRQEAMVFDEGKYYTVLLVADGEPESYEEDEYAYGKYIRPQDRELKTEYLQKRRAHYQSLLEALEASGSEKAAGRLTAIREELLLAERMLARMSDNRKSSITKEGNERCK